MAKEMLRAAALAALGTLLVAASSLAACGDGTLDGGEECDLGAGNGAATTCCTTLCEFRAAGNTCRAVAGPCDVAETCSGTVETCPADAFQPSNVQCRAPAGLCDLGENCTGSGSACPPDSFRPNGTVCRAAAGNCDVAEFCDGAGPACPGDVVEPAGTPCRGTAGACDLAESCDGTNPICPADVLKPNGTVCRNGNGTCDPAETCDGADPACPEDGFAPNDTPCNDGSACTDNDLCFQGVCVGTADIDACLDDFLCYKGKSSAGQPKFTPITGVHLVDQFDDVMVDVTRPRQLCLPADKNEEGIVDTVTHLQAYSIRTAAGSPRHTPRENLLVTNQLGFLRVNTIRPDLLLVPVAKSLTGPQPTEPDPQSHGVDHYKCYKVRVTPGTPRFPERVTVTVTDQFNGSEKTLKLKKPRHLCTPVEKNDEPIKHPTVHLMCYLARGTPKTPRHQGVFLTDQLTARRLDTVREREICIPTEKTLSSPSGAFLDPIE
ncbi:MAG TPA: hypothetical protein VKA21_15080 [Candidatus Binatia bacterium]|nr:hypothetical protein [Candidatus Binatia bacterium]